MIGLLRGQILEISAETALLDVGGVGYEVHCPARLLGTLSLGTNKAVSLVIETVVREDMIRLYGFSGSAERELFRMLQSVQGVGARVALAILSIMTPEDLAIAVAQGDATAFARASGVGPKLAKRLATELKDKTPALPTSVPATPERGGLSAPAQTPRADAISALVNLGYPSGDATRAIAAAEKALTKEGTDVDTEGLIRGGLRELV
ncbi:MAG: Holliday junction branch migration protein RuvA [Alphaproteobacteria bacterium]